MENYIVSVHINAINGLPDELLHEGMTFSLKDVQRVAEDTYIGKIKNKPFILKGKSNDWCLCA